MSSSNEARPLSARVCAIASVVIALVSLWIVGSTAQGGGQWVFSVLACFVPLLFAIQGIRMSRQPGAVWPRFSLVVSILGAALGLVSFAGFLWLVSMSTL